MKQFPQDTVLLLSPDTKWVSGKLLNLWRPQSYYGYSRLNGPRSPHPHKILFQYKWIWLKVYKGICLNGYDLKVWFFLFLQFHFFFFNIYLFILLHWVLIAAYGISVVVISSCRLSCSFCDLSSQARDQIGISCNARQTLNHQTTREVIQSHFLK